MSDDNEPLSNQEIDDVLARYAPRVSTSIEDQRHPEETVVLGEWGPVVHDGYAGYYRVVKVANVIKLQCRALENSAEWKEGPQGLDGAVELVCTGAACDVVELIRDLKRSREAARRAINLLHGAWQTKHRGYSSCRCCNIKDNKHACTPELLPRFHPPMIF